MTKIYSLLIASLFFIGCKTASKAYNKGDYADAIELGVKQLQKNPSDAATRDLVKSAYAFAVNGHEEAIRNLSGGGGENRYEAILKEYIKLQDLYNTVQESPVAANLVQPKNYSEYVQTYRDKAADVHLEAAERWMGEGSKQAFRNAYNEYGYALRYRNTTALKAKREEAYNAALTKVLVVPIQNYGGYGYHSSYQLQQFQNDVMRTLAYNTSNDFVKYFSEYEMRSRNLEPDQVLEMNLGRIVMGRPYDQRSQHQSSKQVVVKEVVYKPDSVVKQYGTVYATVVTTKRTLVSEGEMYLTLRDPKGRILWNDRFTGQHQWQTQFATYTGDERALTDNDRSLLNQNGNQNTPREEEVMGELYRQMQSDLNSRLRNYYSRY